MAQGRETDHHGGTPAENSFSGGYYYGEQPPIRDIVFSKPSEPGPNSFAKNWGILRDAVRREIAVEREARAREAVPAATKMQDKFEAETGNRPPLVGAVTRPDGTLDTSRAVVWIRNSAEEN